MATPEFVGTFTPTERAFLEQSFGACRLTLLARGTRRSYLVLIRWDRAVAAGRHGSPLRGPVLQATYLLDGQEWRLTPVTDASALNSVYSGEFDGELLRSVRPTWRKEMVEGLRSPRPWHIAAIVVLWLLVVAFVVWRVATGHPI